MSVVLPAPVWPTTATVSPGSMAKVTSRRTQSGWDSAWPLPDAASLRFGGTAEAAVAYTVAVLDGRLFRHISIREPDVVEFDAAWACGLLRYRGRDDFYRRVQHLEDAFAGGHR